MESHITREAALGLLRKYNKDLFHLRHALTVEAVMRWYARELGYADDEDFWGLVGLLHDIDFEMYPEEHCIKAPELLPRGDRAGRRNARLAPGRGAAENPRRYESRRSGHCCGMLQAIVFCDMLSKLAMK